MWRRTVGGFVVVFFSACGDSPPTFEDDLGAELTPTDEVRPDEIESALAWSSSGQEIAYLRSPYMGPTRSAVRVVRSDGSAARALDDRKRSYRRIVRAGEWLYIETASGLQAELERVPFVGGTIVPVVPALDTVEYAFAVSEDGASVAYVSGGTLRLSNDTPRGSRALGLGRPLAFSPDGARILVTGSPGQGVSSDGGFSTVNVSDGRAAALPAPSGASAVILAVRWDARGPRAITYTAPHLSILDLSTGASVRVASPGTPPDAVAFGPHGDGAIYATNACVESGGLFRCARLGFTMHLAVPGSSERTVARGFVSGGGLVGFGAPALSPSGDRMAFAFGLRLFVKAL